MLSQIAAAVIAAAAVATGLGVLSRLRPVRWLGRTVVGEPVKAAFRREVAEVVRAELARHPLTNGWGVDAVQAIADQVGADVSHPQHPEGGPNT